MNLPKPISLMQILIYEIRSSWWADKISWPPLQDLASHYFVWKARRKYRRYTMSFVMKQKVMHYQATGEWPDN